jgi:hypothetical protein
MAALKFKKVNSVPGVLEANTIYIVKDSTRHILYITDKDGVASYKSYDSTDIAAITSLYIESLIGQPEGLAALDNNGDIIGNAATASALVTARNINGVPFDGTTDITISPAATDPLTLTSTDSSATLADKVKLFRRVIANRNFPGFVGPSGLDTTLQPLFARNKIGIWSPPGNATTAPGVFGISAFTASGTATARNVATTRMFTMIRRLGYVSSATAGSVAGVRVATAQYKIGGGDGLGGFFTVTRFGISDAVLVTGARTFLGVRNSTAAPTNVEPSTITNCIGIGNGAADTNFKMYYGGSAAQTPIDLGANFPANTTNIDMYELALFSPPNSSAIYYEVTRLNTGHVATGVITGTVGTQIPNTTSLLTGISCFRSNNATAAAVGLDLVSYYIETDF